MNESVKVTPATARKELLKQHPKFRKFEEQLKQHAELLRRNGTGSRELARARGSTHPGDIVQRIFLDRTLSDKDRQTLREYFEGVHVYYQGG